MIFEVLDRVQFCSFERHIISKLAMCSDASNLGSLAMGNFCSLYASLHDTKRTDVQLNVDG